MNFIAFKSVFSVRQRILVTPLVVFCGTLQCTVAVVVMALDFGARDLSLRLGLVYVVLWVAFLRQDTILSLCLAPPGVPMGAAELLGKLDKILGDNLQWPSFSFRESNFTPRC